MNFVVILLNYTSLRYLLPELDELNLLGVGEGGGFLLWRFEVGVDRFLSKKWLHAKYLSEFTPVSTSTSF
jgi:hypothetical protein